MPEVKVEVVPVGIKYLCDSCGNGYMAREDIGLGGSMMLTNPPKYKHECNSCGAEEYFTETYPTVRFEFKEVEQPAPARNPLSEADREKPNDQESNTNQAPMHYYKFNEDGAPIRSDFHFSDGQRITDSGKEKPTA